MLRGNEMQLNQGEKIGKIRRGLGISGQSYYRWRRLYGGLKVNQAKRWRTSLQSARQPISRRNPTVGDDDRTHF